MNNTIITRELSLAEARQAGINSWSEWSCGVETFDWTYDELETAYIFEGEVTVRTAWQTITLKAGMMVQFPAGLHCTWQVFRPIRKVYTFGHDHSELITGS